MRELSAEKNSRLYNFERCLEGEMSVCAWYLPFCNYAQKSGLDSYSRIIDRLKENYQLLKK